MPDLTFANPERMWLLLALPLLLWLLIPPRPRRIAYTAHLPQWHHALVGLKRRRPRALSLRTLFTLLAATAALLAILGLGIAGRPGPTRLVVLLDGSSSMAAHGAFEQARQRVREAFTDLPESVDVRVLRCGGPLLRRFGESARRLHDLGGPGGSQTVELAELAAAIAEPDTVVWTLTDGHGGAPLPAVGALTLLGARDGNAAVIGVRLEDRWPLPQLDVEAEVIAFGPAPLPVRVTLLGAIEPVAAQSIELRPGEPATVTWSAVRDPAGGELAVVVQLAGDRDAAGEGGATASVVDPLPLDDRWLAVLPPLPAPRIAVLADAEAGPFAGIAATVLAEEVGGTVVAPTEGEEVGLLLVDGGQLALVPGTARVLCFGTRLGTVEEVGTGGSPAPAGVRAIDWDRSSPLLRGLDLSELRIERAIPGSLPPPGPGVSPLLFPAAGGGADGGRDGAALGDPLAVTVDGIGPRGEPVTSLHFAFRLADSNLPLSAAFPQLIRRAFVLSYAERALPRVTTAAPAAGEQDLWQRTEAPDRPLPAFGTPDRGLGLWLLLVGAACVVLRAVVRR